jgi:hypothetical protein
LLISTKIDRIGCLAYAAELIERLEVHSFGTMLNNWKLPGEDMWRPSKPGRQFERYVADCKEGPSVRLCRAVHARRLGAAAGS